ncbi:hypothetical protein ACIQPT_33430 [Streptomyces sp. NPDC091289]|uniref:hypothetical protein n=1 Tax=Streptomyces sp. NPDC091289 TaxID=3365989 RepID=UPI00380ABD98
MAAGHGLLDMKIGSVLQLNGVEWTVTAAEPQFSRFVLTDGEGREETRSIRWLIHHPDAKAAANRPTTFVPVGRQARSLDDLTEGQRKRARIRAEHVLEAETGFRDGRADRARPGEPRPAYDPERTLLSERRRAKASELKALPRQEAEMLGLRFMSERTLERLSARSGDSLLLACADGRWTAAAGAIPVSLRKSAKRSSR